MQKGLLKGLAAASVLAGLTVLSVPAQAGEVRGNIPFTFTVKGATLPPGDYTFTTVNSAQLWVRGFAGRAAVALTNAHQPSSRSAGQLVFHKYGDQYILHQVYLGDGSARQLPTTRQERELARATRSGQTAVRLELVVIPAL